MQSGYYDSRQLETGLLSIFSKIFRSRDLIRLLVLRDVSLRYKRSIFGIFWTLLNPLITSLILWAIFVNLFSGKLSSGVSYGQFVLSGILFSTFITQGITMCADSISSSAAIITKVAVTPQVFAVSAGLAAAVNFSIGLCALGVLSFVIGNSIAWTAPLTVFMIACVVILIVGLGLCLSILYIRFDDTRNIVNVLLMVVTYLTPIFYPENILGHKMRLLVELNPLTSYLKVFRTTFSHNGSSSVWNWIYMFATSLFIFALGSKVFDRSWRRMVTML